MNTETRPAPERAEVEALMKRCQIGFTVRQWDEAHSVLADCYGTLGALMLEVERLRGALEKLQAWADAYPLTAFPEPNFARAHELLQAGGMTLDAISASNMRHVIGGVRKLVDEGLKA